MNLTIYKAGEAAEVMKTSRQVIDAACESGALFAVDEAVERNKAAGRPPSSRHAWRIDSESLLDWHRRGRPLVPEHAA